MNVRGSGATMSEGAIDGQGNILGDDEKVRLYLLESTNNILLFELGYICISLIKLFDYIKLTNFISWFSFL